MTRAAHLLISLTLLTACATPLQPQFNSAMAATSPPSVAGGATLKPQAFGFVIAVARTESGFLVAGRTNSPPGTRMNIAFHGIAGERSDQATVGPGGQFYAGEFLLGVGKYVPWPRGHYSVDISIHDGTKSATFPKLAFDFLYTGSSHFVFWKSVPPGSQIARPDLKWAQTGVENRMMTRVASAVQADIASATGVTTVKKPAESDPPNLRTISSAHFGCVHREYLGQLTKYRLDNDQAAWMSALRSGTANGECTQFAPREQVYVDNTALFSGLVKVRKQGETQAYWTFMEAIE